MLLLPQNVALIYCDDETSPREARAVRRERRRAISAQLATTVVRTLVLHVVIISLLGLLFAWMGAFLSVIIQFVPTNRVNFNTFESSGHDCRNHPVFTARLSQ